jgi:hypothetical protein
MADTRIECASCGHCVDGEPEEWVDDGGNLWPPLSYYFDTSEYTCQECCARLVAYGGERLTFTLELLEACDD